jgi:hypothetical protein
MRVACAAVVFAALAGSIACKVDAASTSLPDAASPDTSDAGVTGDRAPSGCLLSTTGFKVAARAENVARTDVTNTANFDDVDNARDVDGKFATITLAEGQESSTLRVSDFGFAIPAGAETWGIEVELRRQAPDGGVADSRIDVEIENKPTHYKVMETPWPKSAMGTHAYGQAVDTWGADIDPSDFNQATFAAKLAVKRADGAVGPVTGLVESLRVAVHYCADPAKK